MAAYSAIRLSSGVIDITETDIMNQIRLALSQYGICLRLNVGNFITQDGRHVSSGLPKGTSDLMFISQGCVAFIEVKTPTGTATPEQLNFIRRMRELGHRAGIARSVEEAMEIVK